MPSAFLLPLSFVLAAAAAAPARYSGPVKPAKRRIVDTHIHFYEVPRAPGVGWPPADADKRLYRNVLPAEYKKLAEKHGIVAAGIVEASPLPADNRWILERTRGDEVFPFFVASLDFGAADFDARLAELVKEPRVVGVRGFLPNPPLTVDAAQVARLRALAKQGMTLDLISRGTLNPKDKIAALARAVPELRIIIDHLGGARDETPSSAWSDGIREVAKLPNVHMKFSSFFDMYNPRGDESRPWKAPTTLAAYKAHFEVIFAAFGEDRLIWGSNWPVCDMGGDFGRQIAIAEEYLASKGPGVRDKVMADNALAFYKRKPPR